MFSQSREWIRRHPIRTGVYALLIVTVVAAVITARGIIRGDRNTLLTQLARSAWVRTLVEREWSIRYSADSIGVLPRCGTGFFAHGVDVELIGVARATLSYLNVCGPSKGAAKDFILAPEVIRVRSAEWDLPRSVQASGIEWRDPQGPIASIASASASPAGLSGSMKDVAIYPVAKVQGASAALAGPPSTTVEIRSADFRGIDLTIDEPMLEQTAGRIEAAVGLLANIGSKAAPFVSQAVVPAKRLLLRAVLIAAGLLLVLKALLTRPPGRWIIRIGTIALPFALFPLLARTGSWIVVLTSAIVLPIVLWAVAYRRSGEWHQKWEPAVLDALAVALALPLILRSSLMPLSLPAAPRPERVSVAGVTIDGMTASGRASVCASGDLKGRLSVRRAEAYGIAVGLNGPRPASVEVARAFAAGALHMPRIDALQALEYIPTAWKRASSTAFCATFSLHNGSAGPLPSAACAPATVNFQAAAGYASRNGVFALDWTGGTQHVALRGSANERGAQIDSVTGSGAPLQIAGGGGTVAWTGPIAAALDFHEVRVAGASIAKLGAKATLPALCVSGPVRFGGHASGLRYVGDGNDIRVRDASFELARPTARALSGNATLNGFAIDGRISTGIASTKLQLDSDVSPELIPARLDGRLLVSAGNVEIASPLSFSGDLHKGAFLLPKQRIGLVQSITDRIPRDLPIDLEASLSPFRASGSVTAVIPKLSPTIGAAGLHLADIRFETSWASRTGLAPVRIGSGWNLLQLPETPRGFDLQEVSKLRISTTGTAIAAPEILDVLPTFPSLPRDLRFRVEGTPQAITVFPENGAPIVIDGIESSIKASFPNLRFEWLETVASARVTRAGNAFPASARARLTRDGIEAEISEPLGIAIRATNRDTDFALTRPLDTPAFLSRTGLQIAGIEAKATIAALKGRTIFDGARLVGLEFTGTLAAGPLVSGRSFDVEQDRPSSFAFRAPSLPRGTASIDAPAVRFRLGGDRLTSTISMSTDLGFSLSPAQPSPIADKVIEVGGAIRTHIDRATDVFGDPSASNFPVAWDISLDADDKAILVQRGNLSLRANADIRRLEVRQELFDGKLDVTANAALADGALLLNVNAPGSVGGFGRRLRIHSPVTVLLRKELPRDSSGPALFQHSPAPNAAPLHVAIGYGDALQFATAFPAPLYTGRGDAVAQAQVSWKPGAAALDSFGRLSFQGLEAGRIALPYALLEDRFDGAVEFRTEGLEAGRLLLSQLLSDGSRVEALDRASFSVKLASAGDSRLPGVPQFSTRLSVEPADRLLQAITQALNLKLPPGALRYKSLAADFRVKNGIVDTEPVLLRLSGVEAPGVEGLSDSEIRVHWGRRLGEPAPRLRDLIYSVQRAIEP